MASVMRLGKDALATGRSMLARNLGRNADGLAALRTRIDQHDCQSLTSLIESEIIPRLMVAHANEHVDGPIEATNGHVTPEDVTCLAPMALEVEADTLLAHVETIMARGVPADSVMVDPLAPVARMLGEYWEDDLCDFNDVTMGLWRLQEVVHELSARAPRAHGMTGGAGTGGRHRALFASMPGDDHNFGTVVIDEVFRNNGWETDRFSQVETPDLLRYVAEGWYDMIGLTISCDCHIAALTPMIAALRNVSMNPQLCVMVGGRVFVEDPDLVVQIGADGTARDAKIALKVADGLVRTRARETAVYR